MAKVIVMLKPGEQDALLALAERERRDPRLQAALLICLELERRGLLPPEPASQQQLQPAPAGSGAA